MIGILCALEEERAAIAAYMSEQTERVLYGISFWEGIMHGASIVVALSGVGKGNAAMTSTLMLSQYDVDVLCNVGIAGGLKKEQQTMDTVLAKEVIQYDFDTSPIDGKSGLGARFMCDEALLTLCEKVLQEEQMPYEIGTIASGDCFVTIHNKYDEIMHHFPECICAEMESGAVAQVANRFQIPCLIIRSLSDVAPNGKSKMDYETFACSAAERAGRFFAKLIPYIHA